jgi:hypothetical protein
MSRPYVLLNSRIPLVFDGNQALCFIVAMNSNVTSAKVKNIAPGAMYTFVFHQNTTGHYAFAWPAQCLNAVMIDQDPQAVTVQNFIGLTGGRLLAVPSGAWT